MIGRYTRINGESFEIVGVLPPQFPLPLRDIDVVAPLVPDRDPLRHARSSVNFLRLVGRLNPGVTSGQAQEELTAICAALRRQFPKEYARKDSVRTRSLQDVLVGDHRQALLFLLASVAVVLSVAMGNLLSLMLVRANERRAEMSVRIAIGASRRQLVQQFTIEALVLTAAGGAAGGVLGVWASHLAVAWAPSSIPRLGEVAFDGRTVLFAAGLTLAATVLLSVAPIGTVWRMRARDALHLGSRGAVGDRWNQRVRNALVVGEIKTDTDPAALRTPFLSHLRSVDRDAAISSTGTMDQYLEAWLAPRRFSLGLFAAFSLTAVLLAVSGLYGLVSYTVSQRRREIGVRMAIGATGRDVHRLILNQAARLALAGTALGLGIAMVARPAGARLVGLSAASAKGDDAAIDPWVMLGTTALLCTVVVVAGWMPARRAARVEPTLALRGE